MKYFKAPGNHGRPLLTYADRVLVTVIYLRQVCPQKVLAALLGSNAVTIGEAIREPRALMDEQKITLDQTTHYFSQAQGTRRGVFPQKITDIDRILATVLAQRHLCNQQTLADLFGVSRGTIRNAVDDVLPLLKQEGHLPEPATRHFATAADVLAFVTGASVDETPS